MKPSVMLQKLPKRAQIRGTMKHDDGSACQWCAMGWLAEHTTGVTFAPSKVKPKGYFILTRTQIKAIMKAWGLRGYEIGELIHTFDTEGRDATVELLQSWGK